MYCFQIRQNGHLVPYLLITAYMLSLREEFSPSLMLRVSSLNMFAYFVNFTCNVKHDALY
jgi:hypothetical protein